MYAAIDGLDVAINIDILYRDTAGNEYEGTLFTSLSTVSAAALLNPQLAPLVYQAIFNILSINYYPTWDSLSFTPPGGVLTTLNAQPVGFVLAS